MSAGLPAEIIEKAQRKVEQYELLKMEIDAKLSQIQEMLGEVRSLISENALTRANPNGLLTRGQVNYN